MTDCELIEFKDHVHVGIPNTTVGTQPISPTPSHTTVLSDFPSPPLQFLCLRALSHLSHFAHPCDQPEVKMN